MEPKQMTESSGRDVALIRSHACRWVGWNSKLLHLYCWFKWCDCAKFTLLVCVWHKRCYGAHYSQEAWPAPQKSLPPHPPHGRDLKKQTSFVCNSIFIVFYWVVSFDYILVLYSLSLRHFGCWFCLFDGNLPESTLRQPIKRVKLRAWRGPRQCRYATVSAELWKGNLCLPADSLRVRREFTQMVANPPTVTSAKSHTNPMAADVIAKAGDPGRQSGDRF